jgi:tRNA-binding protein
MANITNMSDTDKCTYDDFLKVDMRVGRIVRAEEFTKARKPAYKLWIDFAELGVKQSSAQITRLYKVDELLDRLVVAVVNFPPRQIADFMSEVLVLGTEIEKDVVQLLDPQVNALPGARVF